MFKGFPMKVLIDVANGHMQRLFDAAKKAKSIWGSNLILMGGNIANEETYELYADAGFDYVRVGIGGGKGCLSTSNTGVHKPMASLVNDTYLLKKKLEDEKRYEKLPYIIADGGIRGYRDIIKAIALGADYVMIGSVFAKMAESAAPKEEKDGEVYATFYGMASREGQIAMNGEKTKTSEGVKKLLKVEYTMEGWTKNFTDYLRSAMSYLGAKTLDDVREKTILLVNSQNAVNAVNK
jgi:isopentenyl diphosphate isomerase/L-lactate dehydrogenase-like FMN-dependent dehydrogenase